MLKLPFANDSNCLDRRFYTELFHIIGLIETRQDSKKLLNVTLLDNGIPGAHSKYHSPD
ncbi:type IIG restriction enzyme/methyltransferase [Anaerophaga thermohalophila]|uniref:type IIG restriction enzyme/methyltransferase n=1 Tax=Anaerophaga thermohalophila TaxID=177400 RepID=UPI000237D54D|nr:hypothetical protein [Anaerophaga thermohalophila]